MSDESMPDQQLPVPEQYEFNDVQNAVIRNLSQKMFFASIVFLTTGIIVAIFKLAILTTNFPEWQAKHRVDPAAVWIVDTPLFILGFALQSILPLSFGWWLRDAATAFQQVVATQGRDIELLMKALRNLKWIFVLLYWFVIGSLLSFLLINLLAPLAGVAPAWNLIIDILE